MERQEFLVDVLDMDKCKLNDTASAGRMSVKWSIR